MIGPDACEPGADRRAVGLALLEDPGLRNGSIYAIFGIVDG